MNKLIYIAVFLTTCAALPMHATPQDEVNAQLLKATRSGDVIAMQTALEAGANVNGKDNGGLTPLHLATCCNSIEKITTLLRYGANPNIASNTKKITPLHKAASSGHTAIADVLVQHGADVNSNDDSGNTPLHAAASCGHIETVDLLLLHDADIDPQNNSGNTPLHNAAYAQHAHCAQRLLYHGASIKLRNDQLDAPLDAALYSQSLEVATVLLEYGASADRQDKNGESPMQTAVICNYTKFVKLFLLHARFSGVTDATTRQRYALANYAIPDDAGNTVFDIAPRNLLPILHDAKTILGRRHHATIWQKISYDNSITRKGRTPCNELDNA